MNEEQFWTIIESSAKQSGGDSDAFGAVIQESLEQLKPEEIVEFDRLLDEQLSVSYTWQLWGAAYQIQGGCSDDGFEYFRAWLISQGRKKFAAAVADPDSLADWVDPDDDDESRECEMLLGAAYSAYEAVTGEALPSRPSVRTEKPSGMDWDYDDEAEMAKRLPKVSKKF